jgi:LDH2 family malate/lactate/ureidoglycolate dehydrogenase
MFTRLLTATALATVLATTAMASSPQLILDAGTNPLYFGVPSGNSAASSSSALILDAGTNPLYRGVPSGNSEGRVEGVNDPARGAVSGN